MTDLSERQKKTRLGKLDAEIGKVTAELREAAKAEALAAVEQSSAAWPREIGLREES
jgi:hypothetical protein